MRFKSLVAIAAVVAAGWWAWPWIRERVRDGGEHAPRPPGLVATSDGGASAWPEPEGWPPGTEVQIELILGGPQPQYAGLTTDDVLDHTYREVLAQASHTAAYDRNLSRAAREIAAQSAARGLPPPDAAQSFVLAAAGAPDATAMRYLLRTNADGAESVATTVREALAQATPGPGTTVVGIGEASTERDALDRHIVVLVANRPFEVDPVDRRIEPGGTIVVRGVAPGFRNLEGNALYPDGTMASFEVEATNGRFRARVPAGDLTGALALDLDGEGPEGPGKLLQLQIEVGRALPRATTVWVPPLESALTDAASAEAFALELLQLDRRQHGVSTLEVDPELARIARAHSEEMLEAGYFGHLSPTTGLVHDRLRATGYRASMSGENLALNDSLADAQAALMASVGHRRNLLDPRFTHVGVGLARRGNDWLLTQVFGRKVALIDADQARGQVLAALEAARDGIGPLRRDAALEVVAQRGAVRAAAGDAGRGVDQLASALGDEAADVVKSAAGVSVQVIYEVARFAPVELARDPDIRSVGVGVAQDVDRPGAPIGVVVVFAR